MKRKFPVAMSGVKRFEDRDAILIPTPVLSELLVCISPDKIADLPTQLNASIWFRIEAFDSAGAVELAIRTANAIAPDDKRECDSGQPVGQGQI
jgi:hypothetical protein